jgi:CheY-like chemotaxis protein
MIQPPTWTWPATTGERRMPRSHSDREVEILLVEDSPDDADLMVAALNEGTLRVRVTHVEDGLEAMTYLHRRGPYTDSPRPHLILLDLHLPRMNGHEVLAEVMQDSDLRRIPVVIITSSDNDRAISDAYDLHAKCCVCKPANQDEFRTTVQKIKHFWLTFAKRPSGP